MPIDNPSPAAGGWTRRSSVAAEVEVLYPSLAGNPILTPGAAAWTWGSWAVLSASLASDYLPHGLHLTYLAVPYGVTLSPFRWEIEIATGTDGNEVTYATVADTALCVTSPVPDLLLICFGNTLPLGVTLIPSGTRVVARVRKSVADATATLKAGVYLTGHDSPAGASDLTYPLDDHLDGSHTSTSKVTPAGSTLAPVLAAYPSYGAWLEVIASAANDLLVHGTAFSTPFSVANAGHHLQFGIGAGGSESPYALVGCPRAGVASGNGVMRLRRPLLVLAGERLSIRASGGGAATLHQVLYEET
jgi:hypothetical protein